MLSDYRVLYNVIISFGWPAANAAERPVCVKRHVRRATLARYENTYVKSNQLCKQPAQRETVLDFLSLQKNERGETKLRSPFALQITVCVGVGLFLV